MPNENNELTNGLIIVAASLIGTLIVQRLFMRSMEKMMNRQREANLEAKSDKK